MKKMNEYLVTVYNKDYTRLGAYTLYGKNSVEVYNKASERADKDQWFKLEYKGTTVFEDWMLV